MRNFDEIAKDCAEYNALTPMQRALLGLKARQVMYASTAANPHAPSEVHRDSQVKLIEITACLTILESALEE